MNHWLFYFREPIMKSYPVIKLIAYKYTSISEASISDSWSRLLWYLIRSLLWTSSNSYEMLSMKIIIFFMITYFSDLWCKKVKASVGEIWASKDSSRINIFNSFLLSWEFKDASFGKITIFAILLNILNSSVLLNFWRHKAPTLTISDVFRVIS